MPLRPYQQEAVNAALSYMTKESLDPCLIEAATGAGKSHIIAEIARVIHARSGKRILCLAPSAELVMQNAAKYRASGLQCSIFSASAGSKTLGHPVVFGTPKTVLNNIQAFQHADKRGYCLIVIDEAHGITPTVQAIIDGVQQANPNARVLGLTATPYRLGDGYIFREWPNRRTNSDDTARDPYFHRLVYRITAPELLADGYLTPPIIGSINSEAYDTRGMALNARGQYDAADIDRAFVGHGRLTAAVVADVVDQARDRQGVLIFAATIEHAREVYASLPPELSAMVTGETPKKERASILKRFIEKRLKYLVNVAVLTTGFDAPHVDLVAILRKTESAALYQQIIGRGLRLNPGKRDCLILDYTDNIDTHFPDGDIFNPEIKAGPQPKGFVIPATCPLCKVVNEFTIRGDVIDWTQELDKQIDENGYLLDVTGARVVDDHGEVPAHYGRRCFGVVKNPETLRYDARCEYRWTGKDCPECGHENDIAARFCANRECKAELVDPNEKLIRDFRAAKKDLTRVQCDEVTSIAERPGISQAGNPTVRLDIVTPYRTFAVWLNPESLHPKAIEDRARYGRAKQDGIKSVTYYKRGDFFRVLAWNQQPDPDPSNSC